MSPRVLVTGLLLLALVVVLAATVLWLSLSGKRVTRPPAMLATSIPAEPVDQALAPSVPQRTTGTSPSAEPPAEPAPASPVPPSKPPPPPPRAESTPREVQGELEDMGTVIRDYRNALGGNPVGTNAEITAALLGDNAKQTSFEVPEGSSVNAGGEMVDRWSTPYFFHQVSGAQMEIRSAGPDRQMWTQDDVLGR